MNFMTIPTTSISENQDMDSDHHNQESSNMSDESGSVENIDALDHAVAQARKKQQQRFEQNNEDQYQNNQFQNNGGMEPNNHPS